MPPPMTIRRRYWWTLAAGLLQAGMLVAYLNGFALFTAFPTLLLGLACLIGAGFLFAKRSPLGILLLVIGLGAPIYKLVYERQRANFARSRLSEYQAALPTVLELDVAHCRHPPAGSLEESSYHCELQQLLPDRFKGLAQRITVGHPEGGPVVMFQIVRGTRLLVVHAPQWPVVDDDLFYQSLGNGWYTALGAPR